MIQTTIQANADYEVSGGCSLYILTPLNDDARTNLEGGLSDEPQWFAGGVAVEWRFIQPLVEQLRSEGWVIR